MLNKSKQKFLKNDCVVAIDTALKNKVSIEEQTSSKESPAFRHGVCQMSIN